MVRNPLERARSNYFHATPKYSFLEFIRGDLLAALSCLGNGTRQTLGDMERGVDSDFYRCFMSRPERLQGANKRGMLRAGFFIYFLHELLKTHPVHVVPYSSMSSESAFQEELGSLTDFLGLSPFQDLSPPGKADHGGKGGRSTKRFRK
eukprot:scaffold527243_cov45-Prasinocladus_malaysianus.AAC.1